MRSPGDAIIVVASAAMGSMILTIFALFALAALL